MLGLGTIVASDGNKCCDLTLTEHSSNYQEHCCRYCYCRPASHNDGETIADLAWDTEQISEQVPGRGSKPAPHLVVSQN